MTNVEACKHFKRVLEGLEAIERTNGLYDRNLKQAYALAVKALEEQTEVNVYDKEETYHNCTVQVLTNTVTGRTSVGWWKE